LTDSAERERAHPLVAVELRDGAPDDARGSTEIVREFGPGRGATGMDGDHRFVRPAGADVLEVGGRADPRGAARLALERLLRAHGLCPDRQRRLCPASHREATYDV